MLDEQIGSKPIQSPVEALRRREIVLIRKALKRQHDREQELGVLTTAANKSQSSTPMPKFFRCSRTAIRRPKKRVETAVIADMVRRTLGPSSVATYSGVRVEGSIDVAMFEEKILAKASEVDWACGRCHKEAAYLGSLMVFEESRVWARSLEYRALCHWVAGIRGFSRRIADVGRYRMLMAIHSTWRHLQPHTLLGLGVVTLKDGQKDFLWASHFSCMPYPDLVGLIDQNLDDVGHYSLFAVPSSGMRRKYGRKGGLVSYRAHVVD